MKSTAFGKAMAIAFTAAFAFGARAVDYVWTNAKGNSDWNDVGNWTVDGEATTAVPKGGDSASFSVGATIASAIALGDEGELTIKVPALDVSITVKLSGVISGGAGVAVEALKKSNVAAPTVYFANKENTFTGKFRSLPTTSVNSKIQFAKLANAGQPSSIGAGAGENAYVDFNGFITLDSGGSYDTDRPFRFGYVGTQNLAADIHFRGDVTGNVAFRGSKYAHFHSTITNITGFSRTDNGGYYFYSPSNSFKTSIGFSAGNVYFTSVSNKNVACSAGAGDSFSMGQEYGTYASLYFNWGAGGEYVPGDLATDRRLDLSFGSTNNLNAGNYSSYAPALHNLGAGTTLEWNGGIRAKVNDKDYLPRAFNVGGVGDGVITTPIYASSGTLKELRLFKFGKGEWTLCGSNTYVNGTMVQAGRFNVGKPGKPGSLEAGDGVTVMSGATFGGDDANSGPVVVSSGATLAAGTSSEIGTNRMEAALSLATGSSIVVKVDDAGNCDLIDCTVGSIAVGSSVNVSFVKADGTAAPDGRYKFLKGDNLPSAMTFVSAGVSFLVKDGSVTAYVGDTSLVWKGDAENNVWDKSTANWNGGVLFVDEESVKFDGSGVSSVPVQVKENVAPLKTTVTGSADYTFVGPAKITGPNQFVKTGSGTLTLANTNDFTGGIVASAGTLEPAGRLDGVSVSVSDGAVFRQLPGGVIAGNGVSVSVGIVDNGFGDPEFGGTNEISSGTLTLDPSGSTNVYHCFELPSAEWLSGIDNVRIMPRDDDVKLTGVYVTNTTVWGADAANKTIWAVSGDADRKFIVDSYRNHGRSGGPNTLSTTAGFTWPGKIAVEGSSAGRMIFYTYFGSSSATAAFGTVGEDALVGFGGTSDLRGGSNVKFLGRLVGSMVVVPNDGTTVEFHTPGGTMYGAVASYGSFKICADDAMPTNSLFYVGKDGVAYAHDHYGILDLNGHVQHFCALIEQQVGKGGDRLVRGGPGSKLVITGSADSSKNKNSTFGSVYRYTSKNGNNAAPWVTSPDGEHLHEARIEGAVTLEMSAPGRTFDLHSSTNLFTGDVIVSAGTIIANAPYSFGFGSGARTSGELGAGDKNLVVSGGTMQFNVAQAALTNAAVRVAVSDGSAGVLELASGVEQTVRYLHLGGKYMPRGVYGSSSSSAEASRQYGCFSGAGTLRVLSGQCGTAVIVR